MVRPAFDKKLHGGYGSGGVMEIDFFKVVVAGLAAVANSATS